MHSANINLLRHVSLSFLHGLLTKKCFSDELSEVSNVVPKDPVTPTINPSGYPLSDLDVSYRSVRQRTSPVV